MSNMSLHGRVNIEEKERRRKWAQKLTPRPSKATKKSRDISKTESEQELNTEKSEDVSNTESQQKPNASVGFLPKSIVDMLAAKEKKNLLTETDEEEDKLKATTSRKRKSKDSGSEPVIVSKPAPPQCLKSALDFLKERKMSVPRSSAVLKNSNQALRLLSSSGIIRQK